MPYRKSEQAAPKRRGKSAPVLDELVKQFSDRYAFLRELVQNAIDAGASRVRVGVTREGGDRTTFVEDDGSGMSLDVIKGPFLTKFSSSKEGDDTKIGRYGVGFLSVFALSPRLVAVDTETADAAYAIELEPTFAYRVSSRPTLGRKGTRVTIIEATTESSNSDSDHAGLVERALARWCRFAKISIELETGGATRSLNRELHLSAPVTADEERGGIRVLVGPTPGTHLLPRQDDADGAADFAGFYSRGLTLIEATSGPHVLPGLRYRVECSQLAHTISRDDVVRNSAYERARRLVQELAESEIPRLLERSLTRLAEESARLGAIHDDLPALLFAGQALLRDERVVVPLVGASAGVGAVEKVGARAAQRDPVVDELTRRGTSVALDPRGDASWLPSSIRPARLLLTHVVVRLAPSDDAFAVALLRVLRRLGLPVESVLFSDMTDVDGRASRIVPKSDVRERADGTMDLFLPARKGGEDALVVFCREPAMAAAMRLAAGRGALLAARMVWLENRGELPRRVNLSLLDESRAYAGDA